MRWGLNRSGIDPARLWLRWVDLHEGDTVSKEYNDRDLRPLRPGCEPPRTTVLVVVK